MLRYLENHVVSVATAFGTALVVLHLLATSRRRTSQSVLAWLLAVVFLPPLAIPLYLLLGTRKLVRPARPELETLRHADGPVASMPIARVVTSMGLPPPRDGNGFELIADGGRAYERLTGLIRGATRSIHVTVFILGDDGVGWSLVEALADRARAGVDVRLLLDAVGSRPTLRRARRMLEGAGGEVRVFMPLLHSALRGRSNLRSHRKLAIFDGARIFTGGMNLAAEYLGPVPLASRWRDLGVVAEGPIASDAEALFASDWRFAGGEPIAETANLIQSSTGAAVLQHVPSGPDVAADALADTLLVAIGGARARVLAVTPYYVPDDALHRALQLSARRGVRTMLVMPARSNHALADLARRGPLTDLRDAGVELWAYTAGMVHAKALVVDHDFALLGSPNLDMRSLYLNYENALFVYSEPEVAAVAQFIEALRAESTSEAFDLRRGPWLVEQLARLVSPEL